MLLGEAAAGGAADLNRLEIAGLNAAADIENYLPERRAHGDFDKAGVFDIARQRECLCAGAALGAYRLKPL